MKKLIAILCILLLLVGSLAGCGASTEAYEQSASTKSQNTPMESPMADYGYVDGMTSTSITATEEAAAEEPAVPQPQQNMAEKIIYTANVHLETMDFTASVAALDKAVADFGGFVERSEVNGDTSYDDDGTVYLRNRHAFYTVRIPAEKLESFLSQTGGFGNVVSSNKSAQNVTSQYTDFEARLVSLQTQETRLLELIAEAADIDALITLESKLADVRYEIESIQRNLRDLDSKIAYSTVDLSIYEVEIYQPTPTAKRTFWQRLGDAFVRGWKGFVRGLENFFVWLSGAVFTLVIVAAIGTGVFFLLRKFIRKRRDKKEKKHEE